MSHFKCDRYVCVTWDGNVIHDRLPYTIWESFMEYYSDLKQKGAIKTEPTLAQFSGLLEDFIKNIG